MNRKLQVLGVVLGAIVAISALGTNWASAQVPTTVKVDSILPTSGTSDATAWYGFIPQRTAKVAYNPVSNRLQLVYHDIGLDLIFWAGSEDGGNTWTATAGFIPPGAGRMAIAADANDVPYVVYRTAFAGQKVVAYFVKDEGGFNGGLWSLPVALNDTTVLEVSFPDIVVSPDGKHILVTANGLDDNGYVTVSHDGGQSWSGFKKILDKADPNITPISGTPAIGRATMAIALGTGGYAFVLAHAQYDATLPYQATPVYVETHDYGDTWTRPQRVPLPPRDQYRMTGGWWTNGGPVVLNNIAHFAIRMEFNGTGKNEMIEFHPDASGAWTWRSISHSFDPLSGSYGLAEWGDMGVDTAGNLYCVYVDRNLSSEPGYEVRQVFVSASKDGGETWHKGVRLTGKEGVLVGKRLPATQWSDHLFPCSPQVPPVVGNTLYAFLPNGTWFTPVTAIVQIAVPTADIFATPTDVDPRRPSTGGYTYLTSDDRGGPRFNWIELATGRGKRVEDWYNGNQDPLGAARDDGTAGPFPVGFDFHFYGADFDSFFVGANGLLSFTEPVLNTAEQFGPAAKDSVGYFGDWTFPGAPVENTLAPFHADLNLDPGSPSGHGDVYYWTNLAKDSLVVEWYKAGVFGFGAVEDSLVTLELVLSKRDSSITFQYAQLGLTGAEKKAKIGIQKVDTVGVLYVASSFPTSNVPHVGLAVKFGPHVVPTAVQARGAKTPVTFALAQNYPNPFNPATTIRYELAKPARVTLKVYNLLGEEIKTLVDAFQPAGSYTVTWDGRDDHGREMGSGVYFYRLSAGEFTAIRKMIYLR